MQLDQGREMVNAFISGDVKGKCSYIRGGKRKMQLDPGKQVDPGFATKNPMPNK